MSKELIGMQVTVTVSTLIEELKKNRAQHAQMVAEAREGYVRKARETLQAKLDELSSGQIARLFVSLSPPDDHTATYDTALRMLEIHTGKEITLNAAQVRNLVMDEWDWSESWFSQNIALSDTAARVGLSKGYTGK